MLNKPLLILPCSGEKLPGVHPASEKYVGGGYWVLVRSLDFTALMNVCTVAIVSAHYGVVQTSDLLDDYDRTLTSVRFKELAADPEQERKFQALLPNKNYPVYIALPKAYRKLIEVWGGEDLAERQVLTFAPGSGIGGQRSQLKSWVLSILKGSPA